MSANDRTFDDVIVEAKALLEDHDDREYEALAASDKANYQEALEFLSRLESSLDTGESERSEADRSAGSSPEPQADGGETHGDRSEDGIETDLEATMGDDGDVVGPFGGDDVVVYDPDDEEGWLSMRHDATIPLENMQ
ncbi:hypothetical protein [Halalkalicoccus tibetensis]|uniref:Uncharacterized protein n=1 Tax=Halalkalicoccus tibetensis TaxID=175632 RepID=A0ABD5UZD4_9EURY